MENQNRVVQASVALVTLIDYHQNSERDNVVDLVTNLIHYCHTNDYSWKDILETATNHFNEEIKQSEKS